MYIKTLLVVDVYILLQERPDPPYCTVFTFHCKGQRPDPIILSLPYAAHTSNPLIVQKEAALYTGCEGFNSVYSIYG